MRLIIKYKEPESLRLYRTTTPNPTYDGFAAKEDIRNFSLKEQGGICAYCMQRISEAWDKDLNKFKTEIEHYKSPPTYSDIPKQDQDLCPVCNGNQGNPQHLLHCDKSKDTIKNKKYLPLTINPLLEYSIQKIKYRKDGTIYSDDKVIDRDLEIVLNLNEQTLKNNRKEAIDAAYEELDRRHGKPPWKKQIVEKVRKEWDSAVNGNYEPYCQAVIYHLDKIIEKLQKSKN
jgi:uncharacterized protein (TIGR02646 family)